jgi:uncharacterized protein YndB with AHSA1/START domain
LTASTPTYGPRRPRMAEIRITRAFDAPPERVFDAWTVPEAIAAWYGPDGFHAPKERVHVDLRPGGRWELAMVRNDGNGEFTIGYEILEVHAPVRLVMRSDPMPHLPTPTTVRIQLTANGDQTLLTLTDGPMPSDGANGAESGYQTALDKLARTITT